MFRDGNNFIPDCSINRIITKTAMKRTLTLSNPIFKLAILYTMLILLSSKAHAQSTYYDNYAFRIPLTLNNSSLGISTDQTNFVALIKVTSLAFVSSACSDQTGGLSSSIPNFAIIDSAYSTGTELNYQVENYNTTTGVIYFWVKVPLLYKSVSNKLYCYFGSTNPSVTHNAAWQKLTWSNVTATSGINYSGVWHFNENPSGAAPQFSDATVNNNNLSSASSGTVTQNTSSQIGNGITLASTSVLDIGATGLPNSQASQTLSIWASYPTAPTTTANLIVLENSTNPASSGNGTQLGISVKSGTSTTQAWRWANKSTPLVKSSTIPTANTWHYFVYSYDAGANQSYLYVDGALLAGPTSNSSNPPISGTANMVAFGDYINNNIGGSGAHTVGGESYTGTMDESHVIGITLAADWIKAEYVNQKNPDAFTTAGPIQTNSARASATAGYLVYTWKGLSTDVTSASNWDNTTSGVLNEAPVNSNVNWVIPSGKTYYPVLTTNTGVYGLTINSGASINLNGYTLSVGCNIYNSSGGQILYGSNTASKITWNGSIASQYYYGTNTALTAQVGSMEVNNSLAGTVNISGGPLDIFNLLTITKGNLAIGSSPALLTLKSSSTLTASVTAIPATSSITGNVSVERYISGGSAAYRGYRLLSSPVYTGSSGSNYYYDLSYLSLFAPTTGLTGTSGGFTKTGNPTMYLFRDNIATLLSFYSGNYRAISKINNSPLYSISIANDGTFNLNIGTGFVFYYRGNLTNLSNKYFSTTPAEPNVFLSTGTLNQQAVTVINWFTGLNTLQYSTVAGNADAKGFNLVGNPYASSIDWNTYSTTNAAAGIYGPHVGSTIWVDNTINKAYAAYNAGIGTNGATNIIASGQGFFVRADTTGAQLIFNEAAKTNVQFSGPTQATGSTLLLSKAPVAHTVLQYLRLELEEDSINKVDMVVRFSNSAKNSFVVNEDSPYIPGTGNVNLCSKSTDNVDLAINNIPFPKQSQAIKLNVNVTADGTYKLNTTEIKAIPNLYEIWLMDAYKKDSLDMRHNSTYIFQIAKSDTNSYGSNRFSLVIRQNPQLGVHLLDFTATKAKKRVQIVWKTINEENYTYFTVERSIDNGANFSVLGGFVSSAMGTYSFLDKDPMQVSKGTATNRYRLKIEDLNGTISYSNVVTLTYSNSDKDFEDNNDNNISVYPNPATSNINITVLKNTYIKLNNIKLIYDIKIMNSYGLIVKNAVSLQDSWQSDVSNLLPGTYFIQVINNNDKSIVGNSKFVKL
jgi:hypothetical protein